MELSHAGNPEILFRKYARLVTWFANTQIGRDYLKQNSLYIPNEKLGLLLPNGYIRLGTVAKDKIEAQLVVTTGPVYASKLCPALQAIDFLRTNALESQELMLWLLGLRRQPVFATSGMTRLFSTLTVYAVNTDGNINRTNLGTVWANEYGGATGTVDTANGYCGCYLASNNNFQFYRRYFRFNSSALTAAATITAAHNSLYVSGGANGNGTGINIVTFAGDGHAAVATDFAVARWGSTTTINRTYAALLAGAAYYDFTFDATGLTWISKTGNTDLGARDTNDCTNTAYVAQSAGNYVVTDLYGGANPVKLVVDYTLPAVGSSRAFVLD